MSTKKEPKRTLIEADDEPAHRDRDGFVPACCYGSIHPEKNEIGGIFTRARKFRIECGIWVHDADCVERIFVDTVGTAPQKAA